MNIRERFKAEVCCRFENPSGRRDGVKRRCPAGNERRVDAGVERGEPPPMFHGEQQEEMVRDMFGPGQLGMESIIRQRQVVGPELMPSCRYQA